MTTTRLSLLLHSMLNMATKTTSSDHAAGFLFGYKAKRDNTAQKITITILVISLPVLYVSLLHVPPSSLYYDTTFWFIMSNTIIIIVATDSGFLSSPSSNDSNKIYDEYVMHSKARTASFGVTVPSPLPNPVIADCKKSPPEEVGVEFVINVPAEDEKKPEEKVTVITNVPARDEKVKPKEIAEKEVVEIEPAVLVAPVVDQMIQNKRSTMKAQPPERSRSEMGKRSRAVFEKNKKLLRRSATEMKEQRGENHYQGRCDDQYSTMSDEELNKRVEEFIRKFKEIRLMELCNA